MFENMCRLCLGTDDLICIFSEKMADNMKEIILVTSGVEISRSDTVSQMVCSTCCQVTIKMYQFRTKSIKNDKDLKARCAGYNIAQLTNAASAVPPKPEPAPPKPPTPTIPRITIKPVTTLPERYKFAHPSVKEVIRKNPNIVLPNSCLRSHVGAYITLLTDEVDEYFQERNMTDAEIVKLKAEAYELAFNPKKTAPKKRKKDEKRETLVSPSPSGKRARLSTDSNRTSVRLSTDSNKTIASSDGDAHVGKENLRNTANETPKGRRDEVRVIHNSSIIIRSANPAAAKPKTKAAEAAAKGDGSVFASLVAKEAEKKKSPREEITLKSILQSQKQRIGLIDDDDDDVIIDVDGPPSPAPSDKEPPPPKPDEPKPPSDASKQPAPDKDAQGNKIVPEEDFQLFTSRPFLKNGVPKVIIVDGEPVIVCDSDDDKDDDAASDPIIFDLDSRSSTTSKYSDTDKTTFTEALRLAPKALEGSNQPDLSLLALANKSRTLYTCRVCDSQHASLKELKYHERRTHTKCPFCNKRFRSLANRDEHVSTTCLVNRSPVKLKGVRLELTRVDEMEDVVRQYASAFEEFNKASKETQDEEAPADSTGQEQAPEEEAPEEEAPKAESPKEKPRVDVQKPRKRAKDAPMDCDAATADAISELEQFLNYAEVVPVKDKPRERGDDVICISDEECEDVREEPSNSPPTEPENCDPRATFDDGERTIDVVNSEILNDINIHDNDFNVLKAIVYKNCKRLRALKGNKEQTSQVQASLKDSPIVDGNSSRMKIFKNLRKYLNQYKIPIEVKFSPTVSVQYKPTTPPPPTRVSGMWNHMTPQQLKPPPPKAAAFAVINGQMGRGMKPVFQTVPVAARPPAMPNSGLRQVLPKGGGTVQDSNVTTTNLILASSHQPSLLLQPTLTTTSAPFTNYIVVPAGAVLPSTQGPLPVIESVVSAGEAAANQPTMTAIAQLESITNALMPMSQTTDAVVTAVNAANAMVAVTSVAGEVVTTAAVADDVQSAETVVPEPQSVQPAIRVRNLEELS